MEESKVYLKTADFAKLCKVKKDTLLFYDEIGVFSPSKVGQNGYRYYTYDQVDIFSVISALREVGMSLQDIKTYLATKSPENFIKLLTEQEEKITQKIANLTQVKSFITQKKDVTTQSYSLVPGAVFFEELPDEFFVATELPKDCHCLDEVIAKTIAMHVQKMSTNHLFGIYAIGGIANFEKVKQGDFTNYSHFFTPVGTTALSKDCLAKPKGCYLTCCHSGGYDTVPETYLKMLNFINENNLIVESDFFEDTVVDFLSVSTYDDYLLKISIKVSSSNSLCKANLSPLPPTKTAQKK